MPVHDWSRVDAGIFHDFHQVWTVEIRNALNGGGLPEGYFALVEQYTGREFPDVVALERRLPARPRRPSGGLAVAEAPPRAQFITSAEIDPYARKANRVVIKHPAGEVVAVIEVVSPGNKGSLHALRSFVENAAELLRRGISLLVVDLFPSSARDPQGIHKAIWDEIRDERFELPLDKPLTVAAYSAGIAPTAYVQPVAIGEALPAAMPVFLDPDTYVHAPLEPTYEAAWRECPEPVRELVERASPS